MRKVLAGLVIVGLLSFGSGIAYANEIPEVSLPIKIEPVDVVITEVSLEKMTIEMKTAIESQPISIFDYLHFGWDVIFEIGKKLTASTRPLVVFNETIRIGGQITIYETSYFNLIVGRFLKASAEISVSMEFEPNWFFGIELKLPAGIRPQVLIYQGTWYLGISYQI